MPTLRLRGVEVEFPHEPYPCQETYMGKVLEALQTGGNALLESPTGTGKTLCLLCASLAWLLQYKEVRQRAAFRNGDPEATPPRRILYSSRTHAQLAQVIRELKSTAYGGRITMAVLGSREQLCVHPRVSKQKGSIQNAMCRALTKGRQCTYFAGMQRRKKDDAVMGCGEVHDIEDLLTRGRQETFCPFYAEREAQPAADIIFIPYNYLVDADIRRTLGLNLRNNVVIVDEAHNIAGMMTAAASFDLPSVQLANCIGEVGQAIELLHQPNGPDDVELPQEDRAWQMAEALQLKTQLLAVEDAIARAPLEQRDGRQVLVRSGTWALELLAEAGITAAASDSVLDSIQRVITALADQASSTGLHREPTLQALQEHLRTVFQETDTDMRSSFKCLIQMDADAQPSVAARRGNNVFKAPGRTLSLWCMDPSISVGRLVRSASPYLFIFTSGTLSPIASFAAELRLTFPILLENPHVIDPTQVSALVVPKGPGGVPLNASYQSRDKPEYKSELGMLVSNVCRLVPHGVLVFFPSYSVLAACVEWWKTPVRPGSRTTWESICSHKTPVVEPKDSSLLRAACDEFNGCIKAGQGAVFFAVCRGKVSEGLDFADAAGRAVLVTGLPYPNRADLRVQLKKAFLDDHARTAHGSFTGTEWYVQQATRAVNQCIGRILRHRHDYGAVLLCDERFGEPRTIQALSAWLRPRVQVAGSFGEVVRTLSQFFRHNSVADAPARPVATPALALAPHRPAPGAEAPDDAPLTQAHSSALGDRARGFWAAFAPPTDLVRQLSAKPAERPLTNPLAGSPGGGVPVPRPHRTIASPSSILPPPASFPVYSLLPSADAAAASSSSSSSSSSNGTHAPPVAGSPPAPPRTSLLRDRGPPVPGPAPSVVAAAPMPTGSTVVLHDAKLYLQRVRERFTNKEYQEFKVLMGTFKAASDQGLTSQAEQHFKALVEQCITLFGHRRDLLEGFAAFTPSQFQDLYLRMIQASAAAAAAAPRSPSAHKRPASEAAGDGGMGVDLVTGRPRKVLATGPALAHPLPLSVVPPTEGAAPAAPAAGQAPDDDGDPSSTDHGLPGDGAGALTCHICHEAARSPHSSRCGHVCCLECWERWLAVKLECPACRARVRLKLLTKLHT